MTDTTPDTTSKTSQAEKSATTQIPGFAPFPIPAKDLTEPTAEEVREARHYWGELFTDNKRCSETLHRLLTAIAKYIVCGQESPIGAKLTDYQPG